MVGGRDSPDKSSPATTEAADVELGPAGADNAARPGQFIGGRAADVGKSSELFVPMEAPTGEEAAGLVEEFDRGQTTDVLEAGDLEELTRAELSAAEAHGVTIAVLDPATATEARPPPHRKKPSNVAKPVSAERSAPQQRGADALAATDSLESNIEPPASSLDAQLETSRSSAGRLLLIGGGLVAAAAVAFFVLRGGSSASDEPDESAAPRASIADKPNEAPVPLAEEGTERAGSVIVPVALQEDSALTSKPDAGGADDSVQILSNPEGATVYVDGTRLGETPFRFDWDGKPHHLALLMDGHQLAEAEIKEGGDLRFPLEPAVRSSGSGGIKVRCKSEGQYRVFLNGKDTGAMCPTDRLGVSLGEHTIEIYDVVTEERRSFDVSVEDARRSVRVKVD